MEAVVLVSIVTLCVVFIGAMLLLIFLCRYKYCKKIDLLSEQHQQYAPEQTLVTSMEVEEASGVELDHVTSQGRSIEHILQDEEWVNDATGLAPHCLAILRTCHVLSERLVGMTMRGNTQELCSPETMTDLVAIAKRIGPRVDDVVKALYPPLDPRLLEARCAALVLSVSHLVLITKNACRLSGTLDWIDQSLADVDDHLRILREASRNFDDASPQQQQQMMQHSTSYIAHDNQPTQPSHISPSHSNHSSNQPSIRPSNQPSNANTASIDILAASSSPSRGSMRRSNRAQPFVLENQLGSTARGSSNNAVSFDSFSNFETSNSQPFRFGSNIVFEAADNNRNNTNQVNNDSEHQLQSINNRDNSPSNQHASPSNNNASPSSHNTSHGNHRNIAKGGSGRRRGQGGSGRFKARPQTGRSQQTGTSQQQVDLNSASLNSNEAMTTEGAESGGVSTSRGGATAAERDNATSGSKSREASV